MEMMAAETAAYIWVGRLKRSAPLGHNHPLGLEETLQVFALILVHRPFYTVHTGHCGAASLTLSCRMAEYHAACYAQDRHRRALKFSSIVLSPEKTAALKVLLWLLVLSARWPPGQHARRSINLTLRKGPVS